MLPNTVSAISDLLAGKLEKEDPPAEEEIDEEATEEELSELADEIEEEPAEETETEEEDISWASALGVDADKIVLDADGNFAGVSVKVNGKTSRVGLNDLISGYQISKATTQKSQALAAEKKEFETLKERAIEEYKTNLTQSEELTKVLQQKFLQDYQNIDWARLRTESPAEYAATIQDFQLRQAGLNQILATIQNKQQLTAQQQNQLQTKQHEEFMQDQASKILEKYPSWSDPKIANAEFSKMQDFISDYGYSPEEFSELSDARAIAIVQDAMKYRAGVKMSEQKLSKPVPKFQKASISRKSAGTKLDRLVSRAKKTGKREDQVAAVSALISS